MNKKEVVIFVICVDITHHNMLCGNLRIMVNNIEQLLFIVCDITHHNGIAKIAGLLGIA